MPKEYLYNKDAEKFNLELNYIELAKQIVAMNYGTAKMIEALIEAREQYRDKFQKYGPDTLKDELQALLNRGLY